MEMSLLLFITCRHVYEIPGREHIVKQIIINKHGIKNIDDVLVIWNGSKRLARKTLVTI